MRSGGVQCTLKLVCPFCRRDGFKVCGSAINGDSAEDLQGGSERLPWNHAKHELWGSAALSGGTMLALIRELESVGDWNDMRAALGALLGLDAPVADEVLGRAQADDRYAAYLIRSRNHPRLRDMLLNSPDNQTYRLAKTPGAPSSATLMMRASLAVMRWTTSGFRLVDPQTFERRLAVCQVCPHLQEPPARLVYKVALVASSDPRICGICGCVASRKARMSTERCPSEDCSRPGFSRWGEPI
jgi:hypothetical protein